MAGAEIGEAAPAADRLRGLALAAGACFFWSLSGILVRLVEDATSWQIVFWRSAGLLVTILAMLAWTTRGRVIRTVRLAGPTAVLAGLCSCFASAFFILALEHTTVANALFMAGITPFLAAMGAFALMREPVRRVTWWGMALALAGVLVMVSGDLGPSGVLGMLFALGSACSFGGYSVLVRYNRQADMLPAVLWSGIAGLTLAGVMAPLDGVAAFPAAVLEVSLHDKLICLFMGSVQLGLGMTLFTKAARYLPSAELQLMATLEMVLAPVWVAVGVGEYPGRMTLVGGSLIMAAVVLQARHTADPAAGVPPVTEELGAGRRG